MSRQSRGLKLEHTIASEICELTDKTVIPIRAGWSGNSSPPLPDLLIPYRGSLRAVELKSTSQKRVTIKPEDVEDIMHWAQEMTEIDCYAYLSVKCTHYELYTGVLPYPWDIQKSFEHFAAASPFDSNVTKSGNLTLGHPTHYDDDATSAVSGESDGVALLRDLHQHEGAHRDTGRDIVAVHDVLSRF